MLARRLAVLVLSLSIPQGAVALAAPGPIGPEFPAEDQPVPEDRWWLSCTDARGIRSTIAPECVGDHCRETDNLYLERRDPAGNLLAVPLRMNEGIAWRSLFRVSCHANGWVLAQWRDVESGCYLHRLFDPDGNAVSAPLRTVAEGSDCRARASIAVRGDGSFLATWGAAYLDGGSGVILQVFGDDADPASDPVVVTDDEVGWNRLPKVAAGDDDSAVVAWSGDSHGVGPAPVFVRFVDTKAVPFGDTIRLDTFGYGENSPPAITSEGSGVYAVAWSNPILGGRIARRVSESGAAGEVADTGGAGRVIGHTPTEPPRFGAAHVIDSLDVAAPTLESRLRSLDVIGESKWILRRSDGAVQTTQDDGLQWAAPLGVAGASGGIVAVGSRSSGAAVALAQTSYSDRLDALRSSDGGVTWSDAKRVAAVEADAVGCMRCRLVAADVEAAGDDAWVAAWAVEDRVRSSKQAPWRDVQRIAIARSSDNGKTWSPVATIDAAPGVAQNGLALHTDGAGVWVLAWIDQGLHVMRSHDDGRSWSKPLEIADDLACVDCAAAARSPRLETADDRNGTWVTIFVASRYETEKYGYDGDVFVVRSTDSALTWTGLLPVASYAATDASRESDPTLATDGAGLWLAAWTSHRPLGDGDVADPDVVVATSTDGGATWSVPTAARSQVAGELVLDGSPLLAVDERGVWMNSWRSVPYDTARGTTTERFYAAIGDAECGNGEVEPGEACDDGNAKNGDGCDANCTPSRCGNGIVTRREECDDGNRRDDDGCLSDCRIAVCGDGVVHWPDEECDDGNSANDDGCPTSCRIGACGDGEYDSLVEECDDGNDVDNDDCVKDCKTARCGDGFVHDRVEACDDGNRVDDDACPNTCDRAVCGDGTTSLGFEPCDPADPVYAEVCTEDCRMIDLCGDADGDGAVSVTDVQRILRRGVGLVARCPREACDMDSSGAVRAGDAQLGIAKVVGLDVGERCSIGTGNIVFWIDYVGDIGSLQVAVDYANTGGEFVGGANQVACESLLAGVEALDPGIDWTQVPPELPDGLVAFNDEEDTTTLHAAMVSLPGFSGPADLFRCAFVMPEDRKSARFDLVTEDAADTELGAIVPAPLFGYRLE